MPPVGAFIATLITSASVAAATTAFVAAGGWLAVGTFILTQVVLWGVGKLLAPKQSRGGERQADTLTLSLGENPREAVFGMVATGGQLVDCWNHDSGTGDARKNRAEVLVIKLADHEVQSLEGMYVNDEYHAFTGDGDVAAFVISGFGWGLRVYFRAGTSGQTPPSFITSNSGGKWTSTKTMAGCAHVYVVYADNKDRTIWPGGRPRFSWVVKGAKLYDPRKDSTVSGGSGSHRWGTPSTYEWSDNAYLIRYNWVRGIYNGTQLMVGRGLTAEEAPPERAISRANICDEAVTLKAGGTEPRYRAGGVIKSTDTAIDVEEWLAASMAGLLVDRDGVIDIDPGAAQSTVFSITDADLVGGRESQYSPHLNENQRLNTVVARWIDPSQRYADVSTAPRKDSADITADGRPYDVTIDLPFVLSGTQAQRIAEIRRRQGRLERVLSLPLGPKFIGLEIGDWVEIQSDRWLGGDTITAVATAVSLGEDWQVQAAFREINTNVYAWTAASDEQTKGTVLAASTTAPGAIVVDTFTATASTLTTAAGTDPAIQCTWLAFEDGAVSGIEFQVRKNGDTKITTTLVEDTTSLEAFVTNGVGAQGSFDIRARGVSRVPGRTSTWTSWTTVTTGGSSYDNAAIVIGGQNLLTKAKWRAGSYTGGAVFNEAGVSNGVSGWGATLTRASSLPVINLPAQAWPSGEDITLSFIAWRTSGANPAVLDFDLFNGTTAVGSTTFNVTSTPTKFVWTFNSSHASMSSTSFRFFNDSGVDSVINVTDVMIERGNKASDWVPAPGDSDNLLVVRGNNLLQATVPWLNINGWQTYQPGTQHIFYREAGNVWNLTGEPCFAIMQSGVAAEYAVYYQDVPCVAGTRVEMSVYTGAHRCEVQVYVDWFTASATFISRTAITATNSNYVEKAGGALLTDFERIYAFDVAPATSAFARFSVVKGGTISGSDSYAFITRPYFGVATHTQIDLANWMPGGERVENNANVTETRTAAAIAGQTAWATYGTVAPLQMERRANPGVPSLVRNADGKFVLTQWTASGTAAITAFLQYTDQYGTPGFFYATPTSGQETYFFQDIDVVATVVYSFGATIWSGTVSGGGYHRVYAEWINASNAVISSAGTSGNQTASGSEYQLAVENVTAPTGAVKLRFVWHVVGTSDFFGMTRPRVFVGPLLYAWSGSNDAVASRTDAVVHNGSIAGATNIYTPDGTAAAITGQKSGATTQFTAASSAPGSPATGDWWLDTTTTVPVLKRYNGTSWVATNPDSAYVSTGGQIIDYRGLPANATGPYGITRSISDVIGVTLPTTQITIVSHTVYAPGGSISVTGGTITGLTAATVYDCFWRMSNSTLSAEVAGSTAANQKRADPDYLWLATGEPGATANEAQGAARLEYGNYL